MYGVVDCEALSSVALNQMPCTRSGRRLISNHFSCPFYQHDLRIDSRQTTSRPQYACRMAVTIRICMGRQESPKKCKN